MSAGGHDERPHRGSARGDAPSTRDVKPRRRGHLASVHDDLLASTGRGKGHALVMVSALQRAHKRQPIQLVGSWLALHDALDLAPPAPKTARAALALLRELTPVVAKLSGQRWSIDTTKIGSESGHRSPSKADIEAAAVVTKADTESGHRSPSKADIESGHRLDRSGTPTASGEPPSTGRSTAAGNVLAFPRARARVDLDRRPPWRSNPLALAFSERIEACGVHERGHMLAVTLTVADGVDLATVAASFARRFVGACSGAWLVPETSRQGRPHIHGLVITPDPASVVPAWQRCGGGIAQAQHIDPIAPDDREHRITSLAYALKRRDQEPGEVIVTGLLAIPWTFALEGGASSIHGNGDAPHEPPAAVADP